jgi:DNA-binding transcriptional LysR family regulator
MTLPLNAIRAFAAAGRHLSLTAAARELHVTQGADGRLVRLFDTSIPAPRAYHFVYPSADVLRPPLQAFRDWLIARVRTVGQAAEI